MLRSVSSYLIGLGLLAALSACSDDEAALETESDSDATDGSTSEPTTGTSTSTSSSSTTTTTTDGGTDSGAVEPIEYARGIRLERMTVNQGVEVEIVRDGAAVPVDEYPIRMIRGRRTLLRGYWNLHADFEPRELIGRLTVAYPDGSTFEQDFPQMVTGASNESPSASFQWLLEPDQVVPGMEIRARVIEPEPDTAPGEVSDPPPVAPLAGPMELAVADQAMQIEVVLVPILHQFDGCEQAPDVTEEDADAMRKLLEENNAVQEALVTVREPLPFTQSIGELGGFTPINGTLAQAKLDDEAPAHVYYYGIIDSCDGYPAGLGGQAIAIPPAPADIDAVPLDSQGRISSGRWYGSGAAAAETFVHEVGHTQSRYHIRCSGGEAGADNSYPHLGGRIGAWGFGIYDFALRGPTVGRDYMTYCSNAWVSDFGWELTFDVIAVLTEYAAALDRGEIQPRPEVDILAGLIDGDYERWWIERGPAPVPTPGDVLHLRAGDAPVSIPARIQHIPHSTDGRNVRVTLVVPPDAVTAASLEDSGELAPIDLTGLPRLGANAPVSP